MRAEHFFDNGNLKLFRRIFVKCDDSGGYSDVGWVLICDANDCMVCGTAFTSSLSGGGKHHCRACGNVVCDDCSEAREIVEYLEGLGPVRVCNLCYYEQTPVQAFPNIHSGRPVLGEFEEEIAADGKSQRKKFLFSFLVA
jgi:hypothetical protein